jgi:hypothetical protein
MDLGREPDQGDGGGQERPAMTDTGDVEIIEVSPEEYERAVKAALAGLGLTYRQLERQARSGRFTSLRALKLWLAIGAPGQAPAEGETRP